MQTPRSVKPLEALPGRVSSPFLPRPYLTAPGLIGRGGLVSYDPKASVRSRRHQQIVSQILNSLIGAGSLARAANGEDWEIGFVTTDIQKWAPGEPTTLQEALDRLATLAKSLNGGTGP